MYYLNIFKMFMSCEEKRLYKLCYERNEVIKKRKQKKKARERKSI